MENNTFESPQALVQFLLPKEGTMNLDTPFCKGYWRAKFWYNPQVCSCKKKNLSEEIIQNEYRQILNYSETEKVIARNFVGGSFTLILNGELLGTV